MGFISNQNCCKGFRCTEKVEKHWVTVYIVDFAFIALSFNQLIIDIDAVMLQVAGNFHIAPGRSYAQHHVHGMILSHLSVTVSSRTLLASQNV